MARPTYMTQPDVRSVLEWDPDAATSAEQSADSGQLSRAADLVERILADDRASGVMRLRTSLVRLPLSFEPGPGAQAEAAIKALEKDGLFWRILPSQELRSILAWGAMFGFGPGRLQWMGPTGKVRRFAGWLAPQVEHWHARHFSFDTSRQVWTAETGQNSRLVEVQFGGGEWTAYTPDGFTRPWAGGCWRACRLWWLLKQYAIQDWARYSERHGRGVFVLTTTADATDAKRKELAKRLKSLGDESAIGLPEGWSLDLVESTANTYRTFTDQIRLADQGQAIAIAGQNLSSEVQGGSRAAAEVHERVAQSVIDSDSSTLSEWVREQVLAPWAAATFGDPDAAPWPKWNTEPAQDETQRVKVWVDLGTALKGLRDQGLDVDVVAAAEAVGVPLLSRKLEEPEEPEEPTPPGTPPEPAEPDEDDADPEDAMSAQALRRHAHMPRAAVQQDPGDAYLERVADSLGKAVQADLDGHIGQLLRIVRSARSTDDYDAIRSRIVAYYRDRMDPGTISDLTHAGLVLAQLAGRFTAREETASEGT